jgi:hypothetical protein
MHWLTSVLATSSFTNSLSLSMKWPGSPIAFGMEVAFITGCMSLGGASPVEDALAIVSGN